jgi:hypothetical protein
VEEKQFPKCTVGTEFYDNLFYEEFCRSKKKTTDRENNVLIENDLVPKINPT